MGITMITGLHYGSSEFICLAGGVVTILAIIIAYKFTFHNNNHGKSKSASPMDIKKNEDIRKEEAKLSRTPEKGKNVTNKSDDIDEKFEELTKEEVEDIDPVEYSQHIPSHIKRTEQKVAMEKIEADMTDEQKDQERKVQLSQMEAIFKLMEQNQETFGLRSKEDLQNQMKLYM